MRISRHLSAHIYLSIYLCISIHLSEHTSIHLSIFLYLSIRLTVCPSIHLTVCLSVCLYIYPSFSLPLSSSLYLSPFSFSHSLLSLSFILFLITCSELREQKQLNTVIYPGTPAPCLLLGDSIRLTQIIISSRLSLITLLYFHIYFSLRQPNEPPARYSGERTLVIIAFCSERVRLLPLAL